MRRNSSRHVVGRALGDRVACRLVIIVGGLVVCAIGLGCGALGGSRSVRNYYTIDYIPSSSPSVMSRRPYPFALQVGRFDVQRPINRLNIAHRYSPHQIQYYELERWAVRPDYMIRDMVFKHLEVAQLTNRLGVEFFDARPDYRLEGTVDALERLDGGDLRFARLAMKLKMVRIETGDEVWTHSFDQRRRVYSTEMVATVQALSSILHTRMDFVTAQLDSLFLAASTGEVMTHGKPAPVPDMDPQSPEAVGEELDESLFEIIRGR